jgi:hypothetical protein
LVAWVLKLPINARYVWFGHQIEWNCYPFQKDNGSIHSLCSFMLLVELFWYPVQYRALDQLSTFTELLVPRFVCKLRQMLYFRWVFFKFTLVSVWPGVPIRALFDGFQAGF